MKTKIKILILFIILCILSAQSFAQNNLPKWNGYIQTRFSSNLLNVNEFQIRRAKVWIYGNVPKVNFISYKMQIVYRSFKDEGLTVQDAYAELNLKKIGNLRIGRFVPDFMMERNQRDFTLPVLERAAVINSFIHNEKQMARQIGVQYFYGNDSLPLHFSLGVFNANIDKPAHSVNMNLLTTARLNYKISFDKDFYFTIGGYVAFRKLDKSTLTTIYKPDTLISGDDFRFGIESIFHFQNLEIQGEYLKAFINKDVAQGFYYFATYTFWKKNQIVAENERYFDLNPATNDNAWLGIGYNRIISGNTKIMTDFKIQKTNLAYNYLAEIQLQIFFN